MKLEQIAVQLYTLRDFCKTAPDLAKTLKRVSEIGYRAVQVSCVGPIPEREIAQMCADNGLAICATHESGAEICDETDRVIERLKRLGTTHTAYPYPHVNLSDAKELAGLIAKLDKAGAKMREAGLTLSYHNHAIEFQRVAGRVVLDAIYSDTDPANVKGEPDTYWVQHGGADPVAWVARLKNRLPVIHLKDYQILPDGRPEVAEIGAGNLNFKAIIAAAREAGVQWYCVEQDTCPGDPFVSVKQSYDYVVKNLL